MNSSNYLWIIVFAVFALGILLGYLSRRSKIKKGKKLISWIFIILKDGGLDRWRFRDGLFLIWKELNPKPFYEFMPHLYGPFCMEVWDHWRFLQLKILVQGRITDDKKDFIYELTEKGKEIANAFYEALTPEEQKKVLEIIEFLKSPPKKRVAELSKRYPDFYRSLHEALSNDCANDLS